MAERKGLPLRQEEDTYESLEEYELELVAWIREWIWLYSSYAVEVSEEGDIAHIRGKILFQKELERLCRKPVSDETASEYSDKTRELMQRMDGIHKKSEWFIQQGDMVCMEYLCRMFGFSDFEWFVFCMAFAVEIDSQLGRLFCLLQDDFQRPNPTPELCIRMYTLKESEQLELQKELVQRWTFWETFFPELESLERRSGRERTTAVLEVPLKLDSRIVRFIYDLDSEDETLSGMVRYLLPNTELSERIVQQEYLERLEKLYREMPENSFLYISGEKGSGKKFLVRHLGKRLMQPLLLIDGKQLLRQEAELEKILRHLLRESRLKGNAVLCFADLNLEEENMQQQAVLEKLLHSLEQQKVRVVLTSAQAFNAAVDTSGMHPVELQIPALHMQEREQLWKAWLKEDADDRLIERLADRYLLTPGSIRNAVKDACHMEALAKEGTRRDTILYQASQKQLVHRLGKDAIRIQGMYKMEDLILPEEQKKLLSDACNYVQYHHQVYDKWGFWQKVAYGRGATMIFYGPPGTGKTMGAQVIAGELNMELYKVDMAGILSKYVGESEKKLGNIFEQGTKSQSILFFDEADALFGKRSEVKDSQDKYANASTAYLLQKIEEYEGIIILATNLLQNFDSAFCRRFKFIVEFPFPDEVRRREIWERVFPDEMPKEEEIDYAYLAEEFTFSGSQIKNIAVAAAFLAAGEQKGLTMKHILQALKRELKKTGKNMIAGDFGRYYSLMEE